VKKHSVRFLNLVDDAKTRIREITVKEVIARRARGEDLQLIDVREDHEWLHSHIVGARHISKGVLERDVEKIYKDLDEVLILYCGGGYRSALAADNLGKMGYSRVLSLTGGFRAWKKSGGAVGI